MSEHSTEEMLKHIRVYLVVFFALAVLTVVTVWAAYIHIAEPYHVLVAIGIATVKGSLVVAYFMHLVSEKKLIYAVLILTAFFFLFMLFMTTFTDTTMGPLMPDFW